MTTCAFAEDDSFLSNGKDPDVAVVDRVEDFAIYKAHVAALPGNHGVPYGKKGDDTCLHSTFPILP